MIDKIKMNTEINITEDKFGSEWKMYSNIRGRGCSYKFNDIFFFYSFTTRRLTICGRLINTSVIPNRVYNLDEIYVGAAGTELKQEHSIDEAGERKTRYYYESYYQDLPALIAMLNNKLKELLDIDVDVSTFKVTHIEFCYNLKTKYVNRYVELFNYIFEKRDFKRHKNFTIEKKKQFYTSCYIKTKSSYEKNDKTPSSYVVDFYNKYDQLNCLISRAQKALYKAENEYYKKIIEHSCKTPVEDTKITSEATMEQLIQNYKNGLSEQQNQEKLERLKAYIQKESLPFQHIDLQKAEDVLRLEIKGYYELLTNFSRKNGIDNKERPFAEFLNPDWCKDVIVGKYEFFIGSSGCEFYSYQEAKKKVQQTSKLNRVKRKNLLKLLLELSQNSVDIEKARKNKYLQELGIHWFFMPKQWGIDYLESPMKLLDKHILDLEQRRTVAPKRALSAELEASLYDSIKEEDDGTETCYYDHNGDAPLQ